MRQQFIAALLLGLVAFTLAQQDKKYAKQSIPVAAQARDGAGHGGGHGGGGIGGGHGGGIGGGHGGGHGDDFGVSSYSSGGIGFDGGHGGGIGGGHGGGLDHGIGGDDFGHGGGHGGGIGGGHGGGHGGGIGGGIGGGYGAPAPYVEPVKDTGYYYYYYPVVPESGGKKGKGGGLFSGQKGFFGKMMETIMYPIMYPFMRMYDYFDGRALTSRASDYLPVQLFEKIVTMIEEEIYKEECLSRMICQLGKTAEGYDTFIHLSDFFVPEEYQSHLKTFKDSALRKTDCSMKYSCASLSGGKKPI